MRPRIKGGLFLLVAFVLGGAAGALGMGVYATRYPWPPRPERFAEFILRRLNSELKLRPEQRQQVETILRETGEEFARLRDDIRPRFREIMVRSRQRIRQSLDADQQGKFDALADKWERRAQERWRSRGRDRGPGAGDRKDGAPTKTGGASGG